jgi:hypothetical protein
MKCYYAQKYINLYLDGELKSEKIDELMEHIEQCEECREKYMQMNKLHNSLERLFTEKELPLGFEQQLLNKIDKEQVKENKIWNIPMIRNSFVATILIGLIFGTFLIGTNKVPNSTKLKTSMSVREIRNGPCELVNMHKEFNSIEEAEKAIPSILNIKFPKYIPNGYAVNKVIYDINKGKYMVTINYINTPDKVLTIIYTDPAPKQSLDIKSSHAKISEAGKSDGELASISKKSSEVTKEVKFTTSNYDLTILLKYNSEPQASEINDKDELNKIANSIIREKNNDKIK